MSETHNQLDAYASARDQVAALAARKVGALELTDAAIALIESRDDALNAVVVRDFDRAREAARAADAAIARGETGALLGLPMTVKESQNVGGLKTTWGFEFAKDYVAPADSVGVSRLKAAGAVILGKTNVPVALADFQSVNPIYGRTNNPWDTRRTPGGSSGGGAAALAAGMVSLEFGSDIGGSIRNPAHFCGVFGHKSSWNLIPQRGHSPPMTDGGGVPLAVLGPLARTAGDLQLGLDVLAGPEDLEGVGYALALPAPRHDRLADFRVLLLDRHPLAEVDDEVRAGLDGLAGALERMGAKVSRDAAPLGDLAAYHGAYFALLNAALSRGAPNAAGPSGAEFQNMLDAQVVARRRWLEIFRDVDIILAPVHGTPAFEYYDPNSGPERVLQVNGKSTAYFAQLAWAGIATYGNLPATAFPLGVSKAGLPFGAQAIGPYLEDRTTIAFAGMVEREFGGFRRPPGF